MRCWVEAALVSALTLLTVTAIAQPINVEALNASMRTDCAESDNVYVKFVSKKVRRFIVEAVHPTYLASLTADNKAPDFSRCKMSPAADHKFTPRQVTLFDSGNWKLIGFAYPNFWRSTQVPVRIGDKTEIGLHLLQLWTRGRSRDEEVLVLYPADGYWRARPLAPMQLGWQPDPLLPTAYGSSFLVGPVEQKGRPFVDLTEVVFEPEKSAFSLKFAGGSSATLHIGLLDDTRIALDVLFEGKIAPQFAALRSMFVAPDNADVAIAWWKNSGHIGHAAIPIMKFDGASVSEFRAGRARPSRHNTSAPDMVFKDFMGQAK